ncbi:MAG: hypothetical protein V7K98_01995 [Nostoc sp.]|uniref:hypothetical protein n=1 Tax=Nostoc sp. TaxID=1180 RepID=UPI002FF9C898
MTDSADVLEGKGDWGDEGDEGERIAKLMPNAQCSMPNAQCPMPNSQCPMPNAQCPIYKLCLLLLFGVKLTHSMSF